MRRVNETLVKSVIIGLAVGTVAFLTLFFFAETSHYTTHVKSTLGEMTGNRNLADSHVFWHQVAAKSLNDGLFITLPVFFAMISTAVFAFLPNHSRPIIGKVWAIYPYILDDHYLELKSDHLNIVNESTPFHGRDGLLNDLLQRIRNSESNKYIAISGSQGSGKTRLGIELIRRLQRQGWDAGFLRTDVSLEDVTKFRARRKTLVFIDDAGARLNIWKFTRTLLEQEHLVIVVVAGQCLERPRRFDFSGFEKIEQSPLLQECVLPKLPYKALTAISPKSSLDDLQRCDGNPGALLYISDANVDVRFHARRILILAEHMNAVDLLAMSVFCGPLRYADLPLELTKRKPFGALRLLFPETPAGVLDGTIPAIQPSLMADEIAFLILKDMGEDELRRLVSNYHSLNQSAFHSRIANMLKTRWQTAKRMAIAEKLSLLFSKAAPEFQGQLEDEAEHIAALLERGGEQFDVVAAARRMEELWFSSPDNQKLFRLYGESVPKFQEKLASSDMTDEAREVFQRFYEYTRSASLPKLPQVNEYRRVAMAALLTTYKTKMDDALCKTLYVRCQDELTLALAETSVVNAASTMQLFLAMIFDAAQRKNEVELEKLTAMVMDFMQHPACGASIAVHRLFFEIARAASTFYARLDRPGLIEAWLDRAKQMNRNFNSAMDTQVILAEAHIAMELMLTNASLGKSEDMEEAARQFRSLAARTPIHNRRALEPAWATMASAAITCYRESGKVNDVERWAKSLMAMPTEKPTTVWQIEKNQSEIMLSEVKMMATVMETFLEHDHPEAAEKWAVKMQDVISRIPSHGCRLCAEIQMKAALKMIKYYALNDCSMLPEWGNRLISIMENPLSKWNPRIATLAMEATKVIITAALVHGRLDLVMKWQDTADALSVRFGEQPEIKRAYAKIKANRILMNS